MDLTVQQEVVLSNAINKWGDDLQIDMCIEECSELIQALCKHKRGRTTNVKEELADVFIMLKQMKLIFGWRKGQNIQEIIDFKVKRLEERIKS